MKKIFIFFFIPLLSFSSILEDKIYASAQNACYLKNSTNGLSPTDYSPIVSSQTLRNSNEEDYYSSSDANEVCNNWNSNPYVNVDTEMMLNITWELFQKYFTKAEVGIKQEFMDKYWTKKD